MQRFFLSGLIVLFFPLTLICQNVVGVFAGPQTSTAMYSIKHHDQETKHNYGLQAGATFKVPFEGGLFFAPALYYSLKGYKVTLNDPSFPPNTYAVNNDTRIHTVDAAMLLQYDFGTKPAHFFLKAGPALEFAVAGREKYDLSNGQKKDEKMNFSFTDYGYVSASAVAHLGYEFHNGLFIFGHYEHGLSDIINADDGPVVRHRTMGISVGKYFRK
jgi:hypothetical protein